MLIAIVPKQSGLGQQFPYMVIFVTSILGFLCSARDLGTTAASDSPWSRENRLRSTATQMGSSLEPAEV